MTLTRLLRIVWAALWLPTLGLIGFSLALTKPVVAESVAPTLFERQKTEKQRSKQRTEQLYPVSESVFLEGENFNHDNISINRLSLVQPSARGLGRSQDAPPRSRPRMGGQRGDRISHRLPIDALDAMLEVRAQSESFQTLQIFDTEEEKESFTLSLRRPFNRTRQSEFFLSLGFAYRNESPPAPPANPERQPPASLATNPPPPSSPPPSSPPNRPVPPRPASEAISGAISEAISEAAIGRQNPPLTGPPPSSTSQKMSTGVLEFAQGYRQRDKNGQWLARSQFNLGTELADAPAPMNADAQFFSWLGRLERTQAIGNDHQLTLQLESQLSPNGLIPPHQFKMKDRRFEAFARDARPADISGNNGIRLRLEDRMILMRRQTTSAPIVALIPFLDVGYAWGQNNPQRPSQQFLGRTGLGLTVTPLSGLDIQIDYLRHWGDLNAEDDAQTVYVTFGYQADW